MHERTTHLLRAGLAGAESSMQDFVIHVTPWLLAAAHRYLRSTHKQHALAEDIVQDAWLSCLPRLATLQPRDGRMTPVVMKYLTTAIRRRARDILLSECRNPSHRNESRLRQAELEARTMGIVSRAVQRERQGQVLTAIESLERADRDALLLLSIEQVSLSEAAVILGVSPDAAKQRHKRARDRLKQQLPGCILHELD